MQLQDYTTEELDKFAEEKLDNLEYLEASCFTFSFLNEGSATAIIVILSLFGAALLYLKFFRGTATKFFSKLKSKKS